MDQEKIKKWLLVVLVVIIGIILGSVYITQRNKPVGETAKTVSAPVAEKTDQEKLVESLTAPAPVDGKSVEPVVDQKLIDSLSAPVPATGKKATTNAPVSQELLDSLSAKK